MPLQLKKVMVPIKTAIYTSVSFTFGTIEIRAKMAQGDWLVSSNQYKRFKIN